MPFVGTRYIYEEGSDIYEEGSDIFEKVRISTLPLLSCVALEKSVTLSGPQSSYLWNSGIGADELSGPISSDIPEGEWISGSRLTITDVFHCLCVAVNNESRKRGLRRQKYKVFFVFLKGLPVTYWLSLAGIFGESSFYIYFCVSLATGYLSSSNFVTHFGLKSERASIYLF